MRKLNIFYWSTTVLLAALMIMSAIPNIMVSADSVTLFKHLGYPTYIIPFLGVAKLLGSIAILVPAFNRIKEWAYAGFVYDLSGAFYSGLSSGDPLSAWAPLFIGFALIAVSYILWHKKRNATARRTNVVL